MSSTTPGHRTLAKKLAPLPYKGVQGILARTFKVGTN